MLLLLKSVENNKMIQIFGNWGRIRSWIDKRIRIKATENTFVGEDAGKITTGNENTFIGYRSGYFNTSGYRNNFMGSHAGHSLTTGDANSFIGHHTGYSTTTGRHNTFVGYKAGYFNIAGDNNIFVGYTAGYYETGSDKLFIDNRSRSHEADARLKALIYGVFDAATANQRVNINAQLLIKEVPTYANDADAGAGGLVAGEVYKKGTGSLCIKL